MKQNKSNTFIFIGFSITAITLFTFYFVTYSSLKTTVSQSKEEQLVLKMMRHLDNLQSYESDIESTERPYILSIEKDKKIARKFREAATNYTNELKELRKLSDSSNLPGKEILQLLTLSEKKLSFSEEVIRLGINGDPKAAIAALVDREDRFDNPFRDQYIKLSDIGRGLLRSFQEEHDANATSTFFLFGLLGLIAILIIGLLYYRIWVRAKSIETLSEDLKLTNVQLKKYIEEQNNSLFENAQDVIGIVNDKGEILKVNASVETLFGYSRDEVLKMNINDLLFPEDLVHDPFDFDKVPKEGSLLTESRYRKKDGTTIYAEMKSSYLPDGTFMGILRDMTDRRERETELKMREYAMAKAMSGIGITNMSGTITYANEALAKMWGASSTAELIGKKLIDCFDGPRIQQTITSLQTKGFDSGEDIGKRIDDSLFDVQFVANVIFDDKGMPVCMFGSFTDITEIKNQREEVNKLANIIESSTALIGTMDMQFKILFINKRARNAIEIDEDVDIKGIDAFKFFGNKITPIDEVLKEIDRKGYWEGENILISSTGKETPIFQSVFLHRNEKGEPSFYSSNAIDITESKEKQRVIYDERNFLIKLLDNLPGIFYVYNNKGEFYKWNKNFELLTGYNSAEISRMKPLDFYDDSEKDVVRKRIDKVFNTEAPTSAEIKLFTKNKKKVPLLINSWLIDYHGENVLVGVGVDLTTLKEKEEELNKLAGIVENTQAYVLIVDVNLKLLYANGSAKKKLGIEPDEDITTLSGLDFVPDSTKERMVIEGPKLFSEGKWVGEIDYLTRSGEVFPVLEVAIVHNDIAGFPQYISLTLINIEEQKNAEKELQRLNNELRELSNHLLNIREKERSQIAKEIHDELAQNLVALSMNVAWLKNSLKDKNKDVENILNEQLDITETVIKASRTLFNSLHPSMLDEIGLEAAIQWQMKNVFKLSNIEPVIDSNIENEKFSKEINLAFFRIFQESLTNVLRYSKATQVAIKIFKNTESLYMTIADNGIGFDVEKVDVKQHHGLLGMRERAYALNGKIKIESASGKGTKVDVQVPLFVAEKETL